VHANSAYLRATAATKGRKFYLLAPIWRTGLRGPRTRLIHSIAHSSEGNEPPGAPAAICKNHWQLTEMHLSSFEPEARTPNTGMQTCHTEWL